MKNFSHTVNIFFIFYYRLNHIIIQMFKSGTIY